MEKISSSENHTCHAHSRPDWIPILLQEVSAQHKRGDGGHRVGHANAIGSLEAKQSKSHTGHNKSERSLTDTRSLPPPIPIQSNQKSNKAEQSKNRGTERSVSSSAGLSAPVRIRDGDYRESPVVADVRGGGGGGVGGSRGRVAGAALAAPALLRRGRRPVPAGTEADDAELPRRRRAVAVGVGVRRRRRRSAGAAAEVPRGPDGARRRRGRRPLPRPRPREEAQLADGFLGFLGIPFLFGLSERE